MASAVPRRRPAPGECASAEPGATASSYSSRFAAKASDMGVERHDLWIASTHDIPPSMQRSSRFTNGRQFLARFIASTSKSMSLWSSATHPHEAYLFTKRRPNSMKALVDDGIGLWLAARRLPNYKILRSPNSRRIAGCRTNPNHQPHHITGLKECVAQALTKRLA
jgi:hypothetical protein